MYAFCTFFLNSAKLSIKADRLAVFLERGANFDRTCTDEEKQTLDGWRRQSSLVSFNADIQRWMPTSLASPLSWSGVCA
jgi:hypothetical protein